MMMMMDSEVKQILKSLCFSHGWSYAVFWRYDPLNPMLLRFEEAYNDEQSVAVVYDMMLLQAHILGQGIVGGAALTGNHQWLFSDTLFQCEHEFQNQFLSGFKTIAIIPVGSSGVVQLGSTQKIVESPGLLEETTRALQEMCLKQDQPVEVDTLFESLVPLGGDCEIVVPEGISFEDIFNDENPPSLLSTEMIMVSEEATPNPAEFDILKSYSLDDLYQLLADSPPPQNSSSFLIQGGNDEDKDLLGINSSSVSHGAATPLPKSKGFFSELISSSLSNSSNTPACSSLSNSGLNQSKRRKLETSSSSSAHSSSFFPQMMMMMMMSQEERVVKPAPLSLWIDEDRASVAGEEGVKKKKRAKAGESRKPRPKDRQMIQDRIKDLRGLIPNGAKCSIDTLLDLTIKHMVFMQSIAKYADELRQPYGPKLVKEKERTWAVEVGEETAVCPIIVEDLNTQGQMQIEMVCEESGEFLEIGDLIRGFGLNILKGVMERRQGLVWAHFIVVQANNKPHVTRLQVFWSLVQLFQQHHDADSLPVPPIRDL